MEFKSLSVQRTHDEFYLRENRYKETKEFFKFTAHIAFNREQKSFKLISVRFWLCSRGIPVLSTQYTTERLLSLALM